MALGRGDVCRKMFRKENPNLKSKELALVVWLCQQGTLLNITESVILFLGPRAVLS